MADSEPKMEPGDTEPVICLPVGPDPEPVTGLTGVPSNIICPHFGGSIGSVTSDPYVQQQLEYYERRLVEVERERDELERKFEREKRERLTLHFKYTQVCYNTLD